MTNSPKVLLILAVTFAYMSPASADNGNEPVVRSELKLATGSSSDSKNVIVKTLFDDIDVFFETKRVQANTGNGLQAKLVITNHSDKPVSLRDPADFLQVLLLDAAGYPAQVPRAVPRFRRCNRGQGETNFQHRGQFDVLSANVVGTESVIDGVKHEVHLGPGGKYTLILQVKQMLSDPKENARRIGAAAKVTVSEAEPLVPLETKPMSPSRYQIRAILALVDASPNGPRTVLHSSYMNVSLSE